MRKPGIFDVAHIRLRARIAIIGINPYVPISKAQANRIKSGWRKPLPILLRVNDGTEIWRTNIMPAGNGSFYLYLHGRMRSASKSRVGDMITAVLAFDGDYKGGPTDPMPAWFVKALAKNSAARRGWKALSPSRQKELVRYFVRLQSASARQHNAERAVHVLAGGEGRFMGRSWNVKCEHPRG